MKQGREDCIIMETRAGAWPARAAFLPENRIRHGRCRRMRSLEGRPAGKREAGGRPARSRHCDGGESAILSKGRSLGNREGRQTCRSLSQETCRLHGYRGAGRSSRSRGIDRTGAVRTQRGLFCDACGKILQALFFTGYAPAMLRRLSADPCQELRSRNIRETEAFLRPCSRFGI